MTDEINIAWADFKSLSSLKGFGMQYVDTGDNYNIWFVEDTIKYSCVIVKASPAGTDQLDFEANYKSFANKPVFIGEDMIINMLAIRDVLPHISLVSDNRGAIPKTVVIYNSTDKDITVQLQGDRDEEFDVAMNVGGSFVVATNTHDYATISDYLPYLRISVTASVAPTSGSISAYILRVKA